MESFIATKLGEYTIGQLLNLNKVIYENIVHDVRDAFTDTDKTDLELFNMIHDQYLNLFGEDTNKMTLHRDRMQVEKLKKTPQYEQRTPIWYKVRKNLITATNVAGIIGSSKYDSYKDILKKKIGKGKPFTSNFATEHGKCYEDVAIQMYERRRNVKIHEFGLLKHESISFLGASPDGITDDGIMVEIKCPTSRQINGNVYDLKTTCYFIQMQTQLEVCDLNICDFLECKIEDYDDEKDFLEDNGTELYGENELEKGVVGLMLDKETDERLYFIPDFELSFEDKLAAIAEFHEKNKKTHVIGDNKYWNLKKYSVVRVKRDREFFRKILPTLTEFWDEVLEIRNNPDLYDQKYTDPNKSNSRIKYVYDFSAYM